MNKRNKTFFYTHTLEHALRVINELNDVNWKKKKAKKIPGHESHTVNGIFAIANTLSYELRT